MHVGEVDVKRLNKKKKKKGIKELMDEVKYPIHTEKTNRLLEKKSMYF
jgi:hypothetical protein